MKKGFIAFRLTPESVREIKDISRAQNLPVSEVLRKALNTYIETVRGGGDGKQTK